MKKKVKFKASSLIFLSILGMLFCCSSARAGERLVITDFSGGTDEKGVPEGWELKEKEGRPVFKINTQEDSKNYIHLISENSSFGLAKEIDIDIKEYPWLNFSWMMKGLPKNGDFRKKETDDQAAQVYVAFGRFKLLANLVGYIWENKAPKGTTGTSPAWSRTRLIVLQSGAEMAGEWVQEKRNLYNDYKTLFGEEPGRAKLISMYINSQHTKSRAESYIGDIYFSKE